MAKFIAITRLYSSIRRYDTRMYSPATVLIAIEQLWYMIFSAVLLALRCSYHLGDLPTITVTTMNTRVFEYSQCRHQSLDDVKRSNMYLWCDHKKNNASSTPHWISFAIYPPCLFQYDRQTMLWVYHNFREMLSLLTYVALYYIFWILRYDQSMIQGCHGSKKYRNYHSSW